MSDSETSESGNSVTENDYSGQGDFPEDSDNEWGDFEKGSYRSCGGKFSGGHGQRD